MPSPKAILCDITDHGLDHTKAHSTTNKRGRLVVQIDPIPFVVTTTPSKPSNIPATSKKEVPVVAKKELPKAPEEQPVVVKSVDVPVVQTPVVEQVKDAPVVAKTKAEQKEVVEEKKEKPEPSK